MRKLLPLLATVAVLPLATTLVSNANTVYKENSSLNIINQFKTLNKNKLTEDNGNINWDAVKNNFDSEVDSNQLFSGQFTPEQKSYLKSQSNTQSQTFAKANISDSSSFSTYLKDTNKDYKTYYDDISKAGKTVSDKIVFEYFSQNKIDLKLDGLNTYQDVVNVLSDNIKAEYPSSNIVISLSDSSLANKTLFDDSTLASIINFVQDKISVHLNVQVDSENVQALTIQLKNLQLAKASDQKWLIDAVTSYFNDSNAQDLNLRLEDTRQTAFNRMLDKIKLRFPNYDSQIKLSLTNQSGSGENFFNTDIINDVINQSAWIGVNIASSSLNKNLRLYFDFNLNDLEMNEVIDQTFLTGGQVNPQCLGLTTDDTYQGVIDKLNKRLFNLDKTKSYQAFLVDPNQASTTLDTQYSPDKKDIVYHVNVGFQMKFGNETKKLGSSNLNLVDVTLGENAKKIKQKYDQFNQLMSKLGDTATIVGDLAIATSFAASAMWATSWYFGISIAPAIALTGVSLALGFAASLISIEVSVSQKSLSSLWGFGNTLNNICLLAINSCRGLYGIFEALLAEVTIASWANIGLIGTIAAALMAIPPTVQLIEKQFH